MFEWGLDRSFGSSLRR